MSVVVDSDQRLPASPRALLRSFIRHLPLTRQLVQREVVSRYRGSIAGLAWSFFHPLVMLLVYTFVFSVVFKARWGGTGGTNAGFAVFLYVGIIVHSIFAECVNRAPGLIVGNTNYVKRVVFPLEVLTTVAMGSALFHAVVSVAVLFVVQFFDSEIRSTAVYLPIVLLPLVVMTMGVAWILAAVGVYIRDIGYVTQILTTIMLFMAPVFYPISAMPEQYRGLMLLNPLTFIIEQARRVLILGKYPDWLGLLAYAAISTIFMFGAFWVFQRMRRGFADVL